MRADSVGIIKRLLKTDIDYIKQNLPSAMQVCNEKIVSFLLTPKLWRDQKQKKARYQEIMAVGF